MPWLGRLGVRRFLGQATGASVDFLHRLAHFLFGAAVFCLILAAGLAWRLSQGPVDLGFLTGRIEAALNTEGAPTQISIGGLALTWEGFHEGVDHPLYLRLNDVALVDETGLKRMQIPRAALTLSLQSLLFGRIVPRTVELDGVRFTVLRGADNTVSVDLGSMSETADSAEPPQPRGVPYDAVLAELMRPPGNDRLIGGTTFSQLRRIRLSGAIGTVHDQRLGASWQASYVNVDLTRGVDGGIQLAGDAALVLGDQQVHVTLTASSSPNRESLLTHFAVTPIRPASLSRLAPGLSGLAVLDAPIAVHGDLTLSQSFEPTFGKLTMDLGAGVAAVAKGTVPIRSASVTMSGTPSEIGIDSATLVLPGFEGRLDSTLSVIGFVHRGPQRLMANLTLGLDHMPVADLPQLWPAGLGGGARPWILENMTEGTAENGHVELVLEANADFSGLALTKAGGTLDAQGVTVTWLHGAPGIEQGRAQLRITDADTFDITMLGGRQRVGNRAPIVLTGGSMRITGMSVKDQDAVITVHANGSLGDVVTLLQEPRLKLLSAHPMDLRDPAGDATIALKFKLPLESWITLDDVDIDVSAQLKRGHLASVAAGHDLDQADLDITADKAHLAMKGHGLIAGISAQIDGLMDFHTGKPKDVQQRVTVSGKPSVGQLATAGLNIADTLSGEIPLQAIWSKLNNGDSSVAIEADLTGTTATLAPLAWRKPGGAAAKASALLVLSKDRLASIDNISAEGSGLSIRGSAEMAGGNVTAVRLDRFILGRTNLTGMVRLPANGPTAVDIRGPYLDLAAKLAEKSPRRDKSKPEPPPGPAWTLTGAIGQVLLANGQMASNVQVNAGSDGRIYRTLRISGNTGSNAPFTVDIGMESNARRINVRADDAGAFLKGMDAIQTFEGGQLTLTGSFDDTKPAHPLNATADVTNFRVRNAPALGKLLQAMTLYGLVDAVSGPGLGFARLTAPFTYEDNDLELKDARAFSSSLGMTAKGHLDLSAEVADVDGTIVPAYFFNSLLGNLPLLGGLFSAEKGGGLFAARYTIRGAVSDPTVSVNPLSILTPGFLRGVFGLF